MSKKQRCGATLEYEQFANMRVFTQAGARPMYNWRCPACGASGVNNGKTLTCQRTVKQDAKMPDGKTQRAHAKQMKLIRMYREGWKDGAGFREAGRAPDPDPKDGSMQDAYNKGWHDGRAAFRHAMTQERQRLGLPPAAILIPSSCT